MKKLFFIIAIFLIFISFINSQDIPIVGELIIDFVDRPATWDVTVNIQALGTHWNCNHQITNEYSGGIKAYDENSYPYHMHLSSTCWVTMVYEPYLALGLYEVTISQPPPLDYWVQFRIDWRTSELPPEPNEWIDQRYEYSYAQNDIWRYNDPQHTSINGLTLKLWDENELIGYNPENLEPYPPTSLTQTARYGAPHLQWQHPAISYHRTGYKIYRSLGSPNNFSPIGTTSQNTNTYIDNGLILNGGGTAYYKVTTVNGSIESVFSNTIEVSIVEMGKITQPNEIITQPRNSLGQNFPNPFNPITIISFSLKENSFTTLRVFDILGREVAILVNEILTVGSHQVEFDGSTLESGIYFYEIRANDFKDVKKLILVK